MTVQSLSELAKQLVADHKGLLAIDESNTTCNARFAKRGIGQTEEMRRHWRELLITTPHLNEAISGVILYDETIRQKANDGTPFTQVLETADILIGIKVDTGAKALAGHPGETVTEGLDGLRERLHEYYEMGARFAKWRAVITLGEGLPTPACSLANAHALARYAALCQEAGIVPIIEAEVLMTGAHNLDRCLEVTSQVLTTVFEQLHRQDVSLEGMILKPNMVLPGLESPSQPTPDEVADATMILLLRAVPAAVPGIAFLSGGQSGQVATARLNAMNIGHNRFDTRPPWALTFSFGRAIQQSAIDIWRGDPAKVSIAQKALYHRASLDRAARQGIYTEAMELI